MRRVLGGRLLLLAAGLATAQPLSTFPEGVASGDVTPYSAVLWTRAARPGLLDLEVAFDERFSRLAFRGSQAVTAASDFTAKVDAFPLQPDTLYFYRWRDGGAFSETGRFRTAPPPGSPAGVRFVFAGDSDGTMRDGKPAFNRFEVLEAALSDRPDFFVYLGDTIYADSPQRAGGPAATLEQFRHSYRVNRSYPALRELMRATSTYAIWDDHEVREDWTAAEVPRELAALGRQAFFEYMPLRESHLPATQGCVGPPLFRLFRWGSEVLLIILDERSCRGQSALEACRDGSGEPDLMPLLPAPVRAAFNLAPAPSTRCLEALANPARAMIGSVQMEVLKLVLRYFPARFKFIINQVPVSSFYVRPYDRWEGYPAEREDLLRFIARHRIPNVVFLAADLHASMVAEVCLDPFREPDTIATEVVTGPIATVPLLDELNRDPRFRPNLLNLMLPLLRIECASLDRMAYGLVEVEANSRTARITIKDQQGQTLCVKLLRAERD